MLTIANSMSSPIARLSVLDLLKAQLLVKRHPSPHREEAHRLPVCAREQAAHELAAQQTGARARELSAGSMSRAQCPVGAPLPTSVRQLNRA